MTALEHLNFLSSPAKHWPSYSPLIKAGYKGESCLCARVCINHRPGITLLRQPGGEKYRTLRPGLGESSVLLPTPVTSWKNKGRDRSAQRQSWVDSLFPTPVLILLETQPQACYLG